MITHRIAILVVAFWMFGAIGADCQPVSGKWGEVSDEHLLMSTFDADTSASALVLSDVGVANVDPRTFQVTFGRHTRIKILTVAGYEFGDVEILFNVAGGDESVDDVDGQTFVRQENGETAIHKLDKNDVFEEKVSDEYRRKRFTLPALEPGAIIEYRYTVRSESPAFLPSWSFQADVPTRWSEYLIQVPDRLQYMMFAGGVSGFDVRDSRRVMVRGTPMNQHRWALADVPALRPEPYMTTVDDYRSRLEIQLAGYTTTTGFSESYLQTWESVGDELIRGDVKRSLNPDKAVRRMAEEVVAGQDDDLARLIAIYDFVRSSFTITEIGNVLSSKRGKDVLSTRTGSPADINVLVISMARAAGLDAHPALISTRDNGKVLESYPFLGQFNYLLAAVKVDSTRHLLDATDPLRPYDLLPLMALNERAWLLREDKPAWIDVDATGAYRRFATVDAVLDEEGSLTGFIKTTDAGYAALEGRRLAGEDGPESVIRAILPSDLAEAVIDSVEVDGQDDVSGPFTVSAYFAAEDYAQVAGDFIYVNPRIVGRREENPLRSPDRSFPVDMGYPHRHVYMVNIVVPDRYVVHEKPDDVASRLPRKGGILQSVIRVDGNTVNLVHRFNLEESTYAPDIYKSLRRFFARDAALSSAQVVLKQQDDVQGLKLEDQ